MLTHLPAEPPHGLAEVCAAFGDARTFRNNEERWEIEALRTVRLPTAHLIWAGDPTLTITHVRAHHLVVDLLVHTLERAIRRVPATRFKYGGAYAYRLQRGSTSLSMHAWGIAVDIEPLENPRGRKWRDDGHMLDSHVIEIFKAEGWHWGNDFPVPDPMHFQYAVGA